MCVLFYFFDRYLSGNSLTCPCDYSAAAFNDYVDFVRVCGEQFCWGESIWMNGGGNKNFSKWVGILKRHKNETKKHLSSPHQKKKNYGWVHVFSYSCVYEPIFLISSSNNNIILSFDRTLILFTTVKGKINF